MKYQEYFLSFFKKKPESTQIQKDIEMIVTNGLDYDTRTQYVKIKPDQLITIVQDHKIHDTPEGLRIHLAELDARTNPSRRLNDLITTYKQIAVDMTKLPYLEVFDEIPKPNYNMKAINF